MTVSSVKAISRIDEIDGLRAVAVLAVLAYHYDKTWLPQGYLGVDIFYAISGLVITRAVVERLLIGEFTLNDFFLRRAKRLLPALACMLMPTILAAECFIPRKAPLITGIAGAYGLSNLALWFADRDYFTESTDLNPLAHTWSLGVEEQFYLLFPICVLLLWRRPSRMPWLLSILAATSLAAYLYFWNTRHAAVFFLSPFRAWELLSGSLVYFASRSRFRLVNGVAAQICKECLLLALLGFMCVKSLPDWLGTVAVTLVSCIVLHLVGAPNVPSRLLSFSAATAVGRSSYSLYLWHWPVAVFSKLLLPETWILPAYIVLTALLAVSSYRLLEVPLRNRKWQLFRGKFVLAYAAYALLIGCPLLALWAARAHLYLGPRAMTETQFLQGDKCHIPAKGGLSDCLHPEPAVRRTVWLVGDSHAGNHVPALRKATQDMGWGFQHLTGRSLYESLAELCFDADCDEGSAPQIASRLTAIGRPGDPVIIGFAGDRFNESELRNAVFLRNFERFVATLRAAKLAVMLVQDIPKVCTGDFSFLRAAFQPTACTRTAFASMAQRQRLSSLFEQVRRSQGVVISDPHHLLCDASGSTSTQCSNWLAGQLLYLDASPHMTRHAGLLLVNYFAGELQRISLSP